MFWGRIQFKYTVFKFGKYGEVDITLGRKVSIREVMMTTKVVLEMLDFLENIEKYEMLEELMK